MITHVSNWKLTEKQQRILDKCCMSFGKLFADTADGRFGINHYSINVRVGTNRKYCKEDTLYISLSGLGKANYSDNISLDTARKFSTDPELDPEEQLLIQGYLLLNCIDGMFIKDISFNIACSNIEKVEFRIGWSNGFITLEPSGSRMNILDSDGRFIDYLYDSNDFSQDECKRYLSSFKKEVLTCKKAETTFLALKKVCKPGYFEDIDFDTEPGELKLKYGCDWVNRIGDKYIVVKEI